MKSVIIIDPPSGWKFGFPKHIKPELYNSVDFNLNKWLRENGYPIKDINKEVIGVRIMEVKSNKLK